jgi:hypothetical protein
MAHRVARLSSLFRYAFDVHYASDSSVSLEDRVFVSRGDPIENANLFCPAAKPRSNNARGRGLLVIA